jgi:hypothetical protein
VAPFASESVPEGLVSIVRNATGTLRRLAVERLSRAIHPNKARAGVHVFGISNGIINGMNNGINNGILYHYYTFYIPL